MVENRDIITLNWKGIYYSSKEICTIQNSGNEFSIHSIVKGKYETSSLNCEYRIRTTLDWKVTSFNVTYSFSNIRKEILASNTKDGWIINNQLHKEFNSCIDIDITLTPFTNSLPINRLKLPVNTPKQIDVLYINVLENKIYPVKQQYMKRSETEYNFQNVPNDFEADIVVDKEGFVVQYPELFERVTG